MRRTLPLLCILLFAFALRVHWLGRQELRGDEAFSWNYARTSPAEILARIVREGDPQPPLHYWLLWGWMRLTGDSEFAMRAESAFLSLLLVPFVYATGRRLWSAEVGLAAAALTAVHPQQIWLAQDVRNMYQLALVALLAATVLLPRLGHKGWRARAGYAACGALAMYSHYYSLFILIAHGAYTLGLGKDRKPALVHWIVAGGAIAALTIPWAVAILPVYAGGQLADPGSLSLPHYAAAVLGDVAAGPVFPDPQRLIIAASLGALCLVGLWAAPRRIRALLPAIIAVPFVGIYAIVALRSTFNAFYYVFAFPAVVLPAAGGWVAIRRARPAIGWAVLAVALLTFGAGLRNHYTDPQYSKTRGMRQVAARLAEAAQPGDVYLANFPDPAQVYYIRNLKLSYAMQPPTAHFDPGAVNAALDRMSANRTWFVPVIAAQLDAEGYVQSRLLDTALLAEDDRFDKMRLMLFLPPSAANPLNIQFDAGISLVGYTLTSDRLTLVWATESPVAADYTVFVHALAPDGYQVTGHDAPTRPPTSQWKPGQRIVDVHTFDIPADRPISLVAGMYLPATGNRLGIKSAAFGEPNAALVTTLP